VELYLHCLIFLHVLHRGNFTLTLPKFILTCVIIVLSSAMFKSQPTFHFILLNTTERLIHRYLRAEALALVPLHPNQLAYQAGISVETALHQIMVWNEKVLDQQVTALGVFLDIEWVFNSISCGSMSDTLVRHGVDHTIVWWIRATLEGHMAVATLNVPSMRIVVSRGSHSCVVAAFVVPCC